MKLYRESPTVSQLATALVRLELSQRMTVLRADEPRTAGTVRVWCGRRLGVSPLPDTGEVEMALDWLADRGLVRRSREEWEVSPANPQGYRWSKLATEDALKRFVDGGVKKCAWRKCRAVLEGGQPHGRFCSNRCANRHHHDIHGIHGTVR